MEGIINVHHQVMMYVVIIFFFVSYVLARIVIDFSDTQNSKSCRQIHSPLLEIVWTLIPCGILVLIAVPSFALLYSIDEIFNPLISIKILGRQWYWTYELSEIIPQEDTGSLNYDSYMITTEDLQYHNTRLLSVDNPLWIPTDAHVRLLITATDVIHSWAVPSLGVKMDAIPGRLNQVFVFLKRIGLFYGQCSELCGINHAFMPIQLHAVALGEFYLAMYRIHNNETFRDLLLDVLKNFYFNYIK